MITTILSGPKITVLQCQSVLFLGALSMSINQRGFGCPLEPSVVLGCGIYACPILRFFKRSRQGKSAFVMLLTVLLNTRAVMLRK